MYFIIMVQGKRYYRLHFMDKETEAQNVEVTCSRLYEDLSLLIPLDKGRIGFPYDLV